MPSQAQATILLTGFDPFGGEAINPSWQVAQALDGERIAGWRVVALQLPTVFAGSDRRLAAALALHAPQLVVCLGQAGGRGSIDFERIAINVDDARIPDNAGAQPVDSPVVAGGPAAYFATLPIKAMHGRLQAAGIPSGISQTAGTFVCNHVFYQLMHRLAVAGSAVRAGFVHLPWLPAQGTPSLALETLVAGLRLALEAAVLHRDGDVVLAAGALH